MKTDGVILQVLYDDEGVQVSSIRSCVNTNIISESQIFFTMILRQVRAVNYKVLLLTSLSILGFLEIISRNTTLNTTVKQTEQQIINLELSNINYNVSIKSSQKKKKSRKTVSKILLLAYARFVFTKHNVDHLC